MVLSLQVILTTYYTNALSLTDVYPYGTEHGDTMRTDHNLPIASLLAPINNLVRFGPAGLTATRYQVSTNAHTHRRTHYSVLVCNIVQLYTNYYLFVLLERQFIY